MAQTVSLNEVKAELESKVQELQNTLLLQEKQDRKYNLLFYAITEESNEDIEDKFKNIFLNDLKLDMGESVTCILLMGTGYHQRARGQSLSS